jgi:uncharacterized protein DUF87
VNPIVLGNGSDGEPIILDLERLIGSHMCIAANSGAGKSGLIRRLLEETHGQIQHIVLDVEDEFYTLRERFDYVIAGAGADAPATVANAAGLARASLEHGFSLVAQINDLGDDAPAFVAEFLDSLISAPQRLWRPLLIVVDETQRFAPSVGNTEATKAVKALVQRGRKRGYTGIFASLAMSEINPRLRGLVNNWILGRVGQSLDRDTAAKQLGFRPSSEEARGLQALEPRHFWGFGPALTPVPTLFRVADVATTPVRPGQAKVPTPPPAEALRAILEGLTAPAAAPADESSPPDPKLVQAEAAEISRLRAQVDDLQRANDLVSDDRNRWQRLATDRGALLARIHDVLKDDEVQSESGREGRPEEPAAERRTASPPDAVEARRAPAAAREPHSPPPAPIVANITLATKNSVDFGDLSPPKGRVLQVLATLHEFMEQHRGARERGVKEKTWAFLTGTKRDSSTWRGYKAALRGFFAQNGDRVTLTAAGEALFPKNEGGNRAGVDTGEYLVRQFIAGMKPAGAATILGKLLDAWPESMTRAQLAAAADAPMGSSTFRGYLAPLNNLELIEKDGQDFRLARDLMEW